MPNIETLQCDRNISRRFSVWVKLHARFLGLALHAPAFADAPLMPVRRTICGECLRHNGGHG